ncbi:GNAT family N-acetyltransferase [Parabacteroides sp. FAFU027]|uniref:GNAT family N-acetyltransferase n=1 Tax=Parabacteroides sp. FAFU027 TaxID=2922715 RepID=UPI001FAF28D0|nr:GNAT family N-acetyltransferase [Parabacteroides sp. FAFU027]
MQIITDKAGWREAITRQGKYDFYYTYEYHALHNNGEPLLFVFENGDERLCIPLLMRSIEGTPYYDLTSVYGYAGCLYNTDNPSEALLQKFRDEMTEYLINHEVISVFSRLHTLIPNASLIPDGMGEVVALNRTVYIPVSEPETYQTSLYADTLKRQLCAIASKGLSVRTATSLDDWMAFYKIYTRSMDEKQAPDEYFFSTSYMLGLRNATEFKPLLLLAEYEGEVVAGALFVVCGEIMQYHLGGVLPEFRDLSPLKLLIDRARHLASGMKLRYLHLGGGNGAVDNGLFQFKSRFSHHFSTFHIWKWIVDEDIYEHLSEGLAEGRFPRYRNMMG